MSSWLSKCIHGFLNYLYVKSNSGFRELLLITYFRFFLNPFSFNILCALFNFIMKFLFIFSTVSLIIVPQLSLSSIHMSQGLKREWQQLKFYFPRTCYLGFPVAYLQCATSWSLAPSAVFTGWNHGKRKNEEREKSRCPDITSRSTQVISVSAVIHEISQIFMVFTRETERNRTA